MFTINFRIDALNFAKAMCDLGANINHMPLVIYRLLGLGAPRSTTMQLLMADRSVKRLLGILCDVLVRVKNFIFTVDFVILVLGGRLQSFNNFWEGHFLP